jgi:hypothetical protein
MFLRLTMYDIHNPTMPLKLLDTNDTEDVLDYNSGNGVFYVVRAEGL